MKKYYHSYLFLFLAFAAGLSPAQAQARLPRHRLLAANAPRPAPVVPAAAPVAAPVALAGRVETTAGALPGAVVRLPRFGQSCVTDAQGNFRFALPAGTGPEAVVVAYAGFADVTAAFQPGTTLAVVQLLTPVSISLTKQQQLKTYLKNARRAVKHDLRQIR